MYSVCDDLTAGFPHSEICGSKLVCQLPAAYRRLLRPSSPVIAKASTMCTYSLVPITLTSVRLEQRRYKEFEFSVCRIQRRFDFCFENSFDTLLMIVAITTHQSLLLRSSQTHQLGLINLYYFFQIVKELNSFFDRLKIKPKSPAQAHRLRFDIFWWRLTGSNRRPPACKAGALPAELNPRNFWWVWLGSNQRPPRYQHGALTN